MDENLSIYQQLMRPTADFLDQLMGEGGEAMLDKEILKMRDEIGEDQFNEYAEEFFKDTKIDYKTFFGQTPAPPKEVSASSPKKEEEDEEEEIIELPITAPKILEPAEILEPVPAQQEEHTNNS